ncbi:MAG: GntR family transcriptional regulator [Pigmentiphaga sp.]|uniref:GntR family transcriptional regulator n=1 Tax=Pigmentiphaga sp. TaxID=1977564 RepID=UPI0029B362A8|nr:GntR family transcriptional regulator [Pigmentiphaga sp.]MDX3905996.1 GntR family transcriptional regulator [Pigmentiphaga sp.]
MTDTSRITRSPDERVYAAIYRAVQERRLQPGVKLKEVELAQLFKVSRTSVRSALLRLSHTGLVDLMPNRGAAVARLSADDVRQLLAARRAVEVAMVETIALHGTDESIAILQRHVEAQRDAFMAGRPDEGMRLAISFHRVLAAQSGNRILARFLDDLLSRMPLVTLSHGRVPALGDATHAEHIDLVEAIAARDPERARAILVAHLKSLEDQLDLDAPSQSRSLADMLDLQGD